MNFKNIAAAFILTAASYSASAQTSQAAKISTLPNDQDRIHRGVKSGELTSAEAARLKAREARLKMERKDFKQDGVISSAERKDFRKDKRNLSKNIYKQKHDKQDRN